MYLLVYVFYALVNVTFLLQRIVEVPHAVGVLFVLCSVLARAAQGAVLVHVVYENERVEGVPKLSNLSFGLCARDDEATGPKEQENDLWRPQAKD